MSGFALQELPIYLGCLIEFASCAQSVAPLFKQLRD